MNPRVFCTKALIDKVFGSNQERLTNLTIPHFAQNLLTFCTKPLSTVPTLHKTSSEFHRTSKLKAKYCTKPLVDRESVSTLERFINLRIPDFARNLIPFCTKPLMKNPNAGKRPSNLQGVTRLNVASYSKRVGQLYSSGGRQYNPSNFELDFAQNLLKISVKPLVETGELSSV